MGKRWQQRIVYDQHIEPGMAPSPPPTANIRPAGRFLVFPANILTAFF
jgi:hypothetical protein